MIAKFFMIALASGILITYLTGMLPIEGSSNYGIPMVWVTVLWDSLSHPRIDSINWVNLISDIVAWTVLSFVILVLLGEVIQRASGSGR